MQYAESCYLKEFYKRSKANLENIEYKANSGDGEVYEVTQLLNSMVGLLIYPQQKYLDLLKQINDSQVPMFKKYKIKHNEFKSMNYGFFIKNLRNSIAHPNNIKLNGEYEIESITLNSKNNFEIDISVSELKELCYELCETLISKLADVEGT